MRQGGWLAAWPSGRRRARGEAARPLGRTAGFVLLCVLSLFGGLGTAAIPAAAAPIKVAVFPAELDDTSQEGATNGVRADETARLATATRLLTDLLVASGRYEVVPTTPQAAEIERLAPIRKCNGCDVDIARALGADEGIVTIVQKVSNLILDINIYVRDVASGRLIQVAKTSIRGNTDESWERGVRFLVKNRILPGSDPGTPQK